MRNEQSSYHSWIVLAKVKCDVPYDLDSMLSLVRPLFRNATTKIKIMEVKCVFCSEWRQVYAIRRLGTNLVETWQKCWDGRYTYKDGQLMIANSNSQKEFIDVWSVVWQ